MNLKIYMLGVLIIFSIVTPSYAQPSPYSGTWQFSFNGQDSGKGTATIDSNGNITGSGSSKLAGNLTVSGHVTSDGAMELTAASSGIASTGAQFSGRVNQKGKASGHWNNARARMNGQWSAHRTSR